MPGRPAPTTNYLSAVLTASTLQQRNDVRLQLSQANANCYPSNSSANPIAAAIVENNNLGLWDNNLANQMQSSNDPLLSDILDQVIDFVPDDIMQLLEPTGPELPTQAMAIEFIQKSLMQYELVKSTTAVSMPSTPPAYSTANVSF